MPPSFLTKRTGKRGRVQVGTGGGAQNITMRKWGITEKGEVVDTSGFESGGFTTGLIGNRTCEFNFEGVWDAAVNWQDDPPGLYVRHNLQNLTLFLDSVDGTNYGFPYAIISQAAFQVQYAPSQAILYTVTGQSQGPYSLTTGSYTGNAAPNYFSS